MRAYVDGVDWNVVIAFWLFGKVDLVSSLVPTVLPNSISAQALSTTSST